MTVLAFIIPCLITAVLACVLFHIFINANIRSAEKIFPVLISSFIKSNLSGNRLHMMKQDILFQFDDFMQHRLTMEMPVLKMFVDDKLISELKTVFEKELSTILPSVIEKNLSSESNDAVIIPEFKELTNRLQANLKSKLLLLYILNIFLAVLTGILFSFL